MKDAAEAAGLDKMRRQELTPYTIPAFEAGEFAKEQDKFDDFHRAVFKAFWEDSRNIGADDVLKDIFEDCGLDWDEYVASGGGDSYRPTVVQQLMQARAYGISGVPAFILDRYLISGAQPYEVFQQVMQRIDQDRRRKGLWVPGQQ
jgi:predicted DsbA family dithiol-disulfide isomerase